MQPNVADSLSEAIERLHKAGIADPKGDAEHLMAHALQIERAHVPIRMGDPINTLQLATFMNAIDRRALRAPVSQILGRRAFWKHDFLVTNSVLDPRPDTETLIEAALTTQFKTVLDLGTGSGCILLSLLAERPEAHGLGVDCSRQALAVAEINSTNTGVAGRATLQHSDWFSTVTGQFDLIVSNPPYITDAAFETLEPEVKHHEPRIALTPGGDGLAAYRAIAADVTNYLSPQGRVMLEIGFDQGAAVGALLSGAGLSDIRILPDLNGKDRVVAAKLR